MFFGKKDPEKVSLESLEPMLNLMFDKKLGDLEPKGQRITRSMLDARVKFSEACDSLEKLDVEPYTENLYFVNVNAIKNQKAQYAGILRNIINGMVLEMDAGNSYERYSAILSNIDSVTNEVLRNNAKFKQVLYCYSNNLRDFKRWFSEIERFREALRQELGYRSRDFSEYSELKDAIARLRAQDDEIGSLQSDIAGLRLVLDDDRKGMAQKEESDLSRMLSEKRSELSEVVAQASRLSEGISLLVIPLERPSKKFDHISARKRHLHDFISDAAGNLRTEADYDEFRSMLNELHDAVEKGSVEVKNKAESIGAINALLAANIYGMLNSLKSIQQRRSRVDGEIRTIETDIFDIHKGRSAKERTARQIETLEKRIEDAKRSRGSTKTNIEALFMSSYKKSIAIVD